jgi:hypothetical protein
MRRLSKMPSDPNATAALAVKLATEEPEASPGNVSVISQYLATIGRRGGIKGGKARAAALTKSERKAIAKRAAEVRWAAKGR